MSTLRLAVLGPLQITLDGEPVTSVTSPKIQGLLTYLVVEADRAHSREALAELLWSGQETGRQNLRKSLSRLQGALPQPDDVEPFFHITRQEIGFNSRSPHTLDLSTFVNTLNTVRDHNHVDITSCPACCTRLAEIVDLYRGDFVDGLLVESGPFDEWALLKREWVRREVLWALDALARYYEKRGDFRRSHRYAWRQIEIDSLREEAHRQLMTSLSRDGRRSEALAQYEQLVDLLCTELDVAPATETMALYEHIRAGRLDAANTERDAETPWTQRRVTVPSSLHNFPPQFTPFVGRQVLLGSIEERLDPPECRLLTLLGPGGVGKTRLATEAARRRAQRAPEVYEDGIYFVDLSSLDNAEQLPVALADALDLVLPLPAQTTSQRHEALIRWLQGRKQLLVLDNYEHLLPNTDLITELLQGTSGIDLLVTSRAPLHLRAEWLLDVDGLPYPPDDAPLAQTTTNSYPALILFQQAASRVKHDFNPTDEEWRAIAGICRLVQGAPLALELAAARVRELPVGAVANAIEQDFDFLNTTMADVPQRHRSLWAVIDHSWQLLSAEQQAVFSRLSVFRGSFSAGAAHHIAGASDAALEQLANQSLLQRLDREHYALHESLRQFGSQKLAASQSAQGETQRRHAVYYLDLLASQETLLIGPEALDAQAVVRSAFSNVRMAWTWAAVRGYLHLIARCLTAAYYYFNAAGLVQEGKEAVNQALAGLDSERDSTRGSYLDTSLLQARLLAKKARFLNLQGQYEQAAEIAGWATEILSENGDTADSHPLVTEAEVALQWGRAQLHQGRYDAAEGHLEDAQAAAQVAGDPRAEAEIHLNLGTIRTFQNEFNVASTHYMEALRLSRSSGDRYAEGLALNNLGTVAEYQGDYDTASRYFEEAVDVFTALDYRRGKASALSNLGALAAWQGQLDLAVERHQQALQAARALGDIDGEAWSLMALGSVYTHLGRLDDARDHLQAALELNRVDGTRTLEAWTLNHLAQVALEQGRPDEATELAERTRVLAEDLGDELTVAAAMVVEGDVAVQRDQFDRAEETYERALTINRQLDHRSGQARVLTAMARLALARKEPHTALGLVQEVLRLDAASMALDRAQILTVKGQALSDLGEHDQAREVLEQALELHQSMGQKHLADAVRAALPAGLAPS